MPLLCIFLSRLIHQAEGVLIKKYNQKYDAGAFLFTSIVSLFSMVFCLVTDQNGLEFTGKLLLYGMLGGVGYSAASYLTYVALGCGSFVLSRLILSYGLLITILHGLFLGETVTVFGWIGIALVICSLYFVKGKEKGDYVKVTKKWVISISLSVLFAGLYGIMQRQQQVEFSGRYDNEFMVISLAVSAVSLFVLGLAKEGKDLRMLKNCGLYALGAGISNGATNLLSLYVYTIAPMSFVAPMNAGVSMLISFLISMIIFQEKFSKSQYFGVILGVLALLLVNI